MTDSKAYLVGGGLASLSVAAYLLRDKKINGENIIIFDELPSAGGSLDAVKSHNDHGYIMRGFRMLEEKVYSSVFDLMSFIPSLNDPKKTILDEYLEFNERVKTFSRSRLLEDGKAIDSFPFKLSIKDRIKLLKVLTLSEEKIEALKIEDYFSPSFFESNFWFEFCTTFSFQPWHSLEELKRYILRFIQDAPILDTQECIRSTPYNQFESIVLPIKKWLKENGVQFFKTFAVTGLDFYKNDTKKRIERIHFNNDENINSIEVAHNDFVFITNGSMTADSTFGTMNSAPEESLERGSYAWKLWEDIAKTDLEFGKPSVFNRDVDKTKWVSFTATFDDPLFFDLVEKITMKKAGTEGPVTIKDSSWLISFGLPNQPHFIDQPENLTVFWGYGLFPDKIGDFVKKKMSECSGKEILIELVHHLKLEAHLDTIIKSADCVPVSMPFITSQFMPRKIGDRPKVVPKSSENFAFIGQYCEIPDDIVFTLEYSVRSAQIAVYTLLDIDKEPTPIFKGQHNPRIILNTVKAVFR